MKRGSGKAQTRETMRSQVGCRTAVSALPNLQEYNEEGEGQGSDQGDNEESGRLYTSVLTLPDLLEYNEEGEWQGSD